MTAGHTLSQVSETQTDKPVVSEAVLSQGPFNVTTEPILIDSPDLSYSQVSEWINLDMAHKLPMEGQAQAHRNAIGKAEHRKVLNNKVSRKMETVSRDKAERMRACCAVYTVREYADKRLRHGTQTAYCSNRFCANCAHRRSMRLIQRYRPILKEFGNKRWMYHLVLTYKNEPKPVDRKRISENIRNFKRRDFWKEYGLAGGLYSVEVTYNPGAGTFHTHVHLLIYTEKKPVQCIDYGKEENKGRFQLAVNEEMADVWEQVTGNSSIVYGGRVKGGVYEVLKYITKFQTTEDGTSAGLEDMPDEKFKALYTWTVGSRFVSAFGGLYGKVSKAQEQEDETGAIETDLANDYGDEPYTEYVYEFRDRLNRFVIIAEREYIPAVSHSSYTFTRRE